MVSQGEMEHLMHRIEFYADIININYLDILCFDGCLVYKVDAYPFPYSIADSGTYI